MPRISGMLAGATLTLLVLFLGSDGARRLGVCLYRLFFHVQYGDFDAVAHPPDSIDAMIPCYSPSTRGAARREALVAVDADQFLMAMSRDWGTNVVPDPDLFAGHPYRQWAALKIADVAVRFMGVTRPPREQVERALRFVEAARRDHPENGALWLAEGLVCAELGDVEIAMELFDEAASHPLWDEQPEICRHLAELHVSAGFMPIDAAVFASSAMSPFDGIDEHARYRFDLMLADAIGDDDPTRFVELMNLYSELTQCRWRDFLRPNRFVRNPISMAGQAAMETFDHWPPSGDSTYDGCENHELETEAFLAYAGALVSPELLGRVVISQSESCTYYRRTVGDWESANQKMLLNVLWVDSLGNLSLIGIATLCSACLLTLGFSSSRPFPIQSGRTLKIRRWRLLIIVPICGALFCNSIQRRFAPIGLPDGSDPTQVMLAFSVVVGWLSCIAFLGGFAKCRSRRVQISLILMIAVIHLAIMLLCVHFQGATADAIMARV